MDVPVYTGNIFLQAAGEPENQSGQENKKLYNLRTWAVPPSLWILYSMPCPDPL